MDRVPDWLEKFPVLTEQDFDYQIIPFIQRCISGGIEVEDMVRLTPTRSNFYVYHFSDGTCAQT